MSILDITPLALIIIIEFIICIIVSKWATKHEKWSGRSSPKNTEYTTESVVKGFAIMIWILPITIIIYLLKIC